MRRLFQLWSVKKVELYVRPKNGVRKDGRFYYATPHREYRGYVFHRYWGDGNTPMLWLFCFVFGVQITFKVRTILICRI